MRSSRAFVFAALVAISIVSADRRAHACGWDDETYFAESGSLPCVTDALVGAFPDHTRRYYETRVRAADAALAVAPGWIEGLDMKAIALMKLGKLQDAEKVMLTRARIAPEAYASHANLGTLYTFTGDFDRALEHIDKAMSKEPQAHFGREKYHRQLVVYLKAVKDDASVRTKRSFVMPADLTPQERFGGSKARLADAGIEESVFDALVSMIAVYGAKDLPDVYYAAGDALALRGSRRLAWTAYARAIELKHPRAGEMAAWKDALWKAIKAEGKHDHPFQDEFSRERGLRDPMQRQAVTDLFIYRGIDNAYRDERNAAANVQRNYADWETRAISGGLAVWSDVGLATLYGKMRELRPRCKSPGVVEGAAEAIVDGGTSGAGAADGAAR